ncbi:unnamed protein product, partial [Prorocentrum cordatum]
PSPAPASPRARVPPRRPNSAAMQLLGGSVLLAAALAAHRAAGYPVYTTGSSLDTCDGISCAAGVGAMLLRGMLVLAAFEVLVFIHVVLPSGLVLNMHKGVRDRDVQQHDAELRADKTALQAPDKAGTCCPLCLADEKDVPEDVPMRAGPRDSSRTVGAAPRAVVPTVPCPAARRKTCSARPERLQETAALLQHAAAAQLKKAHASGQVNTTETTTLTCYPDRATATCGASGKCFLDTAGPLVYGDKCEYAPNGYWYGCCHGGLVCTQPSTGLGGYPTCQHAPTPAPTPPTTNCPQPGPLVYGDRCEYAPNGYWYGCCHSGLVCTQPSTGLGGYPTCQHAPTPAPTPPTTNCPQPGASASGDYCEYGPNGYWYGCCQLGGGAVRPVAARAGRAAGAALGGARGGAGGGRRLAPPVARASRPPERLAAGLEPGAERDLSVTGLESVAAAGALRLVALGGGAMPSLLTVPPEQGPNGQPTCRGWPAHLYVLPHRLAEGRARNESRRLAAARQAAEAQQQAGVCQGCPRDPLHSGPAAGAGAAAGPLVAQVSAAPALFPCAAAGACPRRGRARPPLRWPGRPRGFL